MKEYRLADTESKFADIIWENEPLTSPELVKLCEQELNWRKSTTYTVLKKLCDRGIFHNENTVVTSKITKNEFLARQSRKYVEEAFQGSLPHFLTAFFDGKKMSSKELEELRKYIEKYEEE